MLRRDFRETRSETCFFSHKRPHVGLDKTYFFHNLSKENDAFFQTIYLFCMGFLSFGLNISSRNPIRFTNLKFLTFYHINSNVYLRTDSCDELRIYKNRP